MQTLTIIQPDDMHLHLRDGEALKAVLRRADQALYAAKGAGRNCVIAAGQNRRGAVRMESAAG